MTKIRTGGSLAGIIVLGIIACWFVNAYKLFNCDFKGGDNKDWKCEAIHGLGLFPPVSLVSVWFDSDE